MCEIESSAAAVSAERPGDRSHLCRSGIELSPLHPSGNEVTGTTARVSGGRRLLEARGSIGLQVITDGVWKLR